MFESSPFDLRHVHPHLRFGTASDRYAGWIGQVYPEDVWADQVSTRTKTLGGTTYEERTLPVESTADYFRHFSVVELDFTFYRPLADDAGKPTSNRFVLERYAEHAPDDARFLLKAPQAFSARTLRRERAPASAVKLDEGLAKKGRPSYVPNPTYLDAARYADQFLGPAADVLGDRLAGVVFEQEYAPKGQSPTPEAFVGELDGFFADVSTAAGHAVVQAHLEVRSPHLLEPPYFAWLESRGLGYVFSHWTWLPSLGDQARRSGGRFTAANGEVVVRLLTPLRTRYEEAYGLAHPFDAVVPALAGTPGAREMIEDAADLAAKAVEAGAVLNVIANNRAFGNAPHLALAVADRVLDRL